MTKFFAALALTIALPAMAQAQTAPAPAAKMDCCEKMKAEGKECCCKDMGKMDHGKHDMKAGSSTHDGHDTAGAKAAAGDSHNHQH